MTTSDHAASLNTGAVANQASVPATAPTSTGVTGSAKTRPPIAVFSAEGIAAVLWTVAADVAIFRGGTYVSIAVFLICTPAIFRIATVRRASRASLVICFAAAMMVGSRLVWLGSPLTIFSAAVLVVAFAMVARGAMPMVIEGIVWIARSVFDGASRMRRYRWTTRTIDHVRRHHRRAAIGLPVIAAVVFGSIFVLANPDWVAWSGQWMTKVWQQFSAWMVGFSAWEIPFCVIAAMVGIGLMRPRKPGLLFGGVSNLSPVQKQVPSDLYPAYRNTLMTLVALFAAYLGVEFWNLWTRDFPPNFYYAGYAHQGAAWLTVALVLATVSLSIIFGRSLRADPRQAVVRRIAWIWCGLNFLLVVAVYHRLSIYVGYNGLTRMRVVGYFGVTLVAIGFALVMIKIARDRSFWWLIRSQLIAMVATLVVYSVTPVDYVAHRYNAWRVRGGDLAPSVMMAVKDIDDEGMLAMFALVDHPNEIIRDGAIARLEDRVAERSRSETRRWIDFQAATATLLGRFEDRLELSIDQSKRRAAIERFRDYAMQWY